MSSENKKRKAKNAYCANSFKEDFGNRLKRVFFYDARQRQQLKKLKRIQL